jgi:hypothetical protein
VIRAKETKKLGVVCVWWSGQSVQDRGYLHMTLEETVSQIAGKGCKQKHDWCVDHCSQKPVWTAVCGRLAGDEAETVAHTKESLRVFLLPVSWDAVQRNRIHYT